MQHMVEAIIAAAIAAVDRHLAHMSLYPRSEPVSSHDLVNNNRLLVASASVATPPPPAGSVAPTTHPAAVSTNNAYPFVAPASVATPPPLAGSVAPTSHPAAVSTNNAYPFVAPAPVSVPLPPADYEAPTANPARPHRGLPPPPATSFAPALDGPLAPAPTDERIYTMIARPRPRRHRVPWASARTSSRICRHRTEPSVCAAFREFNHCNSLTPRIGLQHSIAYLFNA